VNHPDPSARRFEAIFREHHRAVLGYALRRTNPATADDVVAETFLVCWRRLDEVPADALPWLYGVARRCLANAQRGVARRDALADRVGAAVPERGGRDLGEIAGERDALRAAFAELSENDREALRLVAWEGLDLRSAARAAGCSRTAFAVRLHRARRRLAARLEAEEAEPSNEPFVLTEAT
jgi:RNA polymerase sigma-70 factor (ECF subfamily)